MIESNAKAQEYFRLDQRTCVLTLAKSLTLDPDNTNPYQVGTANNTSPYQVGTADNINPCQVGTATWQLQSLPGGYCR